MTFITKDELKAAVELIVRRIQGQDELLDLLIDQMTEANLRLRYVMQSIRYEKPSLLLTGPKEIETMLDRYLTGGRERLLKEIEDAREAVSALTDGKDPILDAGLREPPFTADDKRELLKSGRGRRPNGKATDSRSH